MTFEQLEYFIAVAETDTFYTAADILHMTQSALSKQIMKLEKELDVQLFDRTHRSAQLTYAGKVFYEEAQKLVLEYRKTLNRMEHIKSPVGEALSIGALPILDRYGLRRVLHEFAAEHTGTRITIDEVEEQELMFGLDSDIYDFVIGNEFMFSGRGFTLTAFGEDELIAVFPEGRGPLSSVPLSFLAEHPLCLLNSYTATCQQCLKLFRDQIVIRTVSLILVHNPVAREGERPAERVCEFVQVFGPVDVGLYAVVIDDTRVLHQCWHSEQG